MKAAFGALVNAATVTTTSAATSTTTSTSTTATKKSLPLEFGKGFTDEGADR